LNSHQRAIISPKKPAKHYSFQTLFIVDYSHTIASAIGFVKFWEMVKELENKPSSSQLPMSLNVDDVVVTDKKHMAELFNHHFIKTGFLFDSAMPPCPSNICSSPTPS
jgi:hypothetical protein